MSKYYLYPTQLSNVLDMLGLSYTEQTLEFREQNK